MVLLFMAIVASYGGPSHAQTSQEQVKQEVVAAWNQFIKAAAQGDQAAALQRVNPRSPFFSHIRSLGSEQLRKLASSHVAIDLKGTYGAFVECDVVARNAEGKFEFYSVTFVRSGAAWLIESL